MGKRFIFTLMSLCLITLNSFGQTYTYKIVGKGNAGQYECSGTITQSEDRWGYSTISIYLSDMLKKTYYSLRPEQVDERTIKYKDFFGQITKYKCPNAENVYFFTFPPLYDGQGYTTYKTIKQKDPWENLMLRIMEESQQGH